MVINSRTYRCFFGVVKRNRKISARTLGNKTFKIVRSDFKAAPLSKLDCFKQSSLSCNYWVK